MQDVAPVNNVKVTFYKGQKPLGSLQSTQHRRYKLPSTELFTLDIIPDKEDDLAEYWCEATLELEATGEQHPLAVSSQTVTATVLCKLNRRFFSSSKSYVCHFGGLLLLSSKGDYDKVTLDCSVVVYPLSRLNCGS